MNDEFINEILDKLKNGEMTEYFVKREDFLRVREVVVKREDFKHIRGVAGRGGDVVYTYLEEARS